jgi:hypothetical protein
LRQRATRAQRIHVLVRFLLSIDEGKELATPDVLSFDLCQRADTPLD